MRRAVLALLVCCTSLLAQQTYSGGVFDHHDVTVTIQTNCAENTTTATYQTSSFSFPMNANCREGSISAQVSLAFPDHAPDLLLVLGTGVFQAPLPSTSIEINGKWTLPATNLTPPQGTILSICGNEDMQRFTTGSANFDHQRSCTWGPYNAKALTDASGNLVVTTHNFAQVWIGYLGYAAVTSMQFDMTSTYIYKVSTNDQNQPPPPPISDPAPVASDTMFVATSGPGLNTGCTFRSGGPLKITIPITRYVGATTDDGWLNNPSWLVQNSVIAQNAKLRLLVWDVDSDNSGPPGVKHEVDLLTVNGRNIGPPETQGEAYLHGMNGKWVVDTFEFPIEVLRFPQRGASGIPAQPAANTIQIDIDTLNTSDQWCTSVGWAALSIGAAAPMMLVHGTNAQHDTWEISIEGSTPVEFLQRRGIVFDHMIDLTPNGSPEQNATALAGILKDKLAELGASHVHLITHSKGATDSRLFLSQRYKPGEPFTVLTLFSLGTPSRGTILSDYGVELDKMHYMNFDNDVVWNGFALAGAGEILAMFGAAPVDPARAAQTTASMQAFNEVNRPRPDIRYFSVAGNADADGNGVISAAEATPLFPGGWTNLSDSVISSLATRTYQVLGRTLYVSAGDSLIGPFTAYTSPNPEANDLTSAAHSVHCDICGFTPLVATHGTWSTFPTAADKAIFPYNHSSLRSPKILDLILEKIRELYPLTPE